MTSPGGLPPTPVSGSTVLVCGDLEGHALADLARRYGLQVSVVEDGDPIPGSYWGAPEAGLLTDRLLIRGDTPVHSALHELCHYVCMDGGRRRSLHTDARGDDLEETGVCYLQVLLAPHLGVTRRRLMADMDLWGYSFRLGTTGAWFEADAEDARCWLERRGLIDAEGRPTFEKRA